MYQYCSKKYHMIKKFIVGVPLDDGRWGRGEEMLRLFLSNKGRVCVSYIFVCYCMYIINIYIYNKQNVQNILYRNTIAKIKCQSPS
jgi:hypothetical protein